MKLIFGKTKEGEVTVRLGIGAVPEEFSYTRMVKQLLKGDKFEDNQLNGLSPEEKKKVEEMLTKINQAVDEEED